jgi:hypothetical protein
MQLRVMQSQGVHQACRMVLVLLLQSRVHR